MKRKFYNTPLTCADYIVVGMGQIMVDSTNPSLVPQDTKPTFGK